MSAPPSRGLATDDELLDRVRRHLPAGRRVPKSELEKVAAAMAASVPRDARSPWNDLLGPFYPWQPVATICGVRTRQAVDHRREARLLLGLKTDDGRWVYPTMQFVRAGGRVAVAPGLGQVLGVLVPAADDLAAARWLATANRRLDGERPIDLLGGPRADAVLAAARAQARAWAAHERP